MAVQFSLSYDANGDPVLVENTVTGTRKVINRSPVVSEYKPRFTSNQVDADTETDTDTDTDTERSDIYRYINEMENNADNDQNLSFVQKQNLETYTPEAVEAKAKELTNTQKFAKTVLNFLTPLGQVETFAKVLSKILPEESEEIKAIKQFYAEPEQAALVESIPGMSNYNLVYGNPFNPSYGLADAAARRTATMEKTLANKYGMTAAEIAMAKAGTYIGPVDSALIKRIKKTTDLERKERQQKAEQQYKTTASEEIKERTTNIGDVTSGQQRQADRDARDIERAYDRDTGDSYSGGESTPGDDTSYSDPFDPGGGE